MQRGGVEFARGWVEEAEDVAAAAVARAGGAAVLGARVDIVEGTFGRRSVAEEEGEEEVGREMSN